MRFSVSFDDLSTGAVADTYKTLCAIIAGDTAGYRCRLRSISIGPADNTPQDLNVSIVIKRVDDVSAGSAGTGSAATPVPKDSLSRAAVITAKTNCSAEPSSYGSELYAIDLNRRNSLVKEWLPEDAPVINRDQLIGLLAAPRTAAAAVLSGVMEFEEF